MKPLLEALTRNGIEIQDHGPCTMVLPDSEEQVIEVLRQAHPTGQRIIPMGLGSKLKWCRPEWEQGSALLMSLRRLSTIVDYVPGDGTLTAQAGCPIEALEERVLSGGHRLTPAVPRPSAATLGGTLAAGLSGPDRHKRGPLRHHVLGTRVALVDGSIARSGGRLVKNVTGFDLHRLHTGSRGTLCILLEASLRLYPRADEHTHLMRIGVDLKQALEVCAGIPSLPVEPLACTLDNHKGVWRLHVVLEGRGKAHVENVRDVSELIQPDVTLHNEAADSAFMDLCVMEVSGGWGHAIVQARTSKLPAVIQHLTEKVPEGGHVQILAQMGAGIMRVYWPRLTDAPGADQTEFLKAIRSHLRPFGATLAPREVAAQTHLDLAPSVKTQPGLPWMQAISSELDPKVQLHSAAILGPPL